MKYIWYCIIQSEWQILNILIFIDYGTPEKTFLFYFQPFRNGRLFYYPNERRMKNERTYQATMHRLSCPCNNRYFTSDFRSCFRKAILDGRQDNGWGHWKGNEWRQYFFCIPRKSYDRWGRNSLLYRHQHGLWSWLQDQSRRKHTHECRPDSGRRPFSGIRQAVWGKS